MQREPVFSPQDGDSWWHRNATALSDPARLERDVPLQMIASQGLVPRYVLEVGAANGWRLEEIRRRYQADCTGVDISEAALADGRQRYPYLRLYWAEADCLPAGIAAFDLVLVPFVLHWVPRSQLAWVVAEVDRVLVPGGYLVIADFWPDDPTKVRYHHRADVELWTYKQNYASCWEALGTYREVDCWVYDHDTGEREMAPSDRRAACWLLRKEEQYMCG